MTEEAGEESGPRLPDLLRPSKLYDGIYARPRFVLPTFLLIASAILYLELAAPRVLPALVPDLLDRSLITESALRRIFHLSLLAGSFVLPVLWIPFGAFATWVLLRAARRSVPYLRIVSLLSHAAVWVALGFVAKASIVVTTGHPAPSTNLGVFVRPETDLAKALVGLTNPFLLLAIVWTARGLRHWKIDAARAWPAGAFPWVGTAMVFATLFTGQRLPTVEATVPVSDWPVAVAGCITLRTPPELATVADEVAGDLDRFAEHVGERFGFETRPLRVYLYPDHRTLERAIGERLPVLTTGSVRGTDLLYLEMPGRNAAVTAERGRRNALRFVALMQLAPHAASAPRWFVEGVVHAMVEPGTRELDREFRSVLRRTGLPSLQMLQGAASRSPDGALLARSLVDHVAARHGPETLVDVMKDVAGGEDFRDALFARTRLTATELERGWQDALRRVLEEQPRADTSDTEEGGEPGDERP